jgi:hypothetical protein
MNDERHFQLVMINQTNGFNLFAYGVDLVKGLTEWNARFESQLHCSLDK